MNLLIAIENSGLGTWVRESPSVFAFPGIIVLHAIGMAFLAGTSAAVDLRILGFAPGIPLTQMDKFFRVMWFGLLVNAVSGLLLLAAYPIKAFTNPVFYVKLLLIAGGLIATLWMRANVVRDPLADSGPILGRPRVWALASLAMWAGAIVAGRFLAYTCSYLMDGVPC